MITHVTCLSTCLKGRNESRSRKDCLLHSATKSTELCKLPIQCFYSLIQFIVICHLQACLSPKGYGVARIPCDELPDSLRVAIAGSTCVDFAAIGYLGGCGYDEIVVGRYTTSEHKKKRVTQYTLQVTRHEMNPVIAPHCHRTQGDGQGLLGLSGLPLAIWLTERILLKEVC